MRTVGQPTVWSAGRPANRLARRAGAPTLGIVTVTAAVLAAVLAIAMLNRWIGILCFTAMLSANAALLLKDVLPHWLAGEPPRRTALSIEPGTSLRSQLGIYNSRGGRIGRNWTLCTRTGQLMMFRSWSVLEPIPLPNGMETPRVRIYTDMTMESDGQLSRLKIELNGLGMPAALTGEFVPPGEFPCEWRVAEHVSRFVLDARVTRALGDVLRPFDRLPDLYVGRSWRVEVFNPLTQVLPGWQRQDVSSASILARVTSMETLTHAGEKVSTYVVEAERTRAWVSADGRVLRQEIDLPILGTLTMIDEPYDEQARNAADLHGREVSDDEAQGE